MKRVFRFIHLVLWFIFLSGNASAGLIDDANEQLGRRPDTTQLIHTETITVPEIAATQNQPGDTPHDLEGLESGIWFGPDLSLCVNPGIYWISFEVWGAPEGGGDTYDGQLLMGFDNPLLDFALAVNLGVYDNVRFWKQGFDLDLGIQIDASTVPLPAALWLFGSGLIAFLGIGRRRRV